MRILIIGGTGNISTEITRLLAIRGAQLTLVKRSDIMPEGIHGVHVIACDRTNCELFATKLKHERPFDCVIDMVGYNADEVRCAIETFRGKTKQLIFCSTVDVYSKTPPHYPVTENNGLVHALPSFPYAWRKVECEKLLREAHSRGDFHVTIIRPAFTYNDLCSPGIHTFGGQSYHLDRLLKGKPIIMHGDGTSIWTATHRDDVAAAFARAVANPLTYGQDYNVTGDEWMTHNHIWRTIAAALGAPSPDFVYIPTDLLGKLAPAEAEWCVENFRHNNIFDNSKSKRDLGFTYTVSFQAGVARCVEALKTSGKIQNSDDYPFYDGIVELWRKHKAIMTEMGPFK